MNIVIYNTTLFVLCSIILYMWHIPYILYLYSIYIILYSMGGTGGTVHTHNDVQYELYIV